LEKYNIIDYSLLVGIHFQNRQQSSFTRFSKFFKQDQNACILGNEIYFFGIVDTLIVYSLGKQCEHSLKSVVVGDEHQVSVTDPKSYAERFLKFISDITV